MVTMDNPEWLPQLFGLILWASKHARGEHHGQLNPHFCQTRRLPGRSGGGMKGRRLWVIAFLSFITNGSSLLGIGQGSAGSVARAIEANHSIARNIETQKALGLLAGNPPLKRQVDFFGPFQVDCSVLQMCEVFA